MNQNLKKYFHKNIHIVGASGIEGYTVAKFFMDRGHKNISLHDYTTPEEFRKSFFLNHLYMSRQERRVALDKLEEAQVNFYYKDKYLSNIENQADWIFLSQNWFAYKPNKKLFKLKQEQPHKFRFLIQLYFETKKCKIIGITGTNGKSTTVDLITKMFQNDQKKIWYGGNERTKKQALLSLEEIKSHDHLILEISNRHLKEDLGQSPDIAVITNITPNHKQDHESFEDYKKAKQSIVAYQNSNNYKLILNMDDDQCRKFYQKLISTFTKQKILRYSTQKKNLESFLDDHQIIVNQEKIILPQSNLYSSQYFISNALAASLVAKSCDIKTSCIHKTLQEYKPLKGRMEILGNTKGVFFINDQKSSVAQSTIAGIESLTTDHQPIFLIIGGSDKGAQYEKLAQTIYDKVDRLYTLPGSVKDKLLPILIKKGYKKIYSYNDSSALWENLTTDFTKAKTILLSPAGEGFYSKHFQENKSFKDFYKSITN